MPAHPERVRRNYPHHEPAKRNDADRPRTDEAPRRHPDDDHPKPEKARGRSRDRR